MVEGVYQFFQEEAGVRYSRTEIHKRNTLFIGPAEKMSCIPKIHRLLTATKVFPPKESMSAARCSYVLLFSVADPPRLNCHPLYACMHIRHVFVIAFWLWVLLLMNFSIETVVVLPCLIIRLF
jgi:hypothetical protein